jgi:hypothetical protein
VSHRVLSALLLVLALAASACRQKAAAAPGGPVSSPASAEKPSAPGELVADKAIVDGHLVVVAHSKWDGGQTADMFDANPASMARTEKANPAILEFRLPDARPLKGLSIQMGGADFRMTVTATPAGGGAPKTYTKDFRNTGADPVLDVDFDTGAQPIETLRIELLDLDSDDGHIHIRTVTLR